MRISTNQEHDDRYRRVQVKIERPPGEPRLRAAWKRGYFAPTDIRQRRFQKTLGDHQVRKRVAAALGGFAKIDAWNQVGNAPSNGCRFRHLVHGISIELDADVGAGGLRIENTARARSVVQRVADAVQGQVVAIDEDPRLLERSEIKTQAPVPRVTPAQPVRHAKIIMKGAVELIECSVMAIGAAISGSVVVFRADSRLERRTVNGPANRVSSGYSVTCVGTPLAHDQAGVIQAAGQPAHHAATAVEESLVAAEPAPGNRMQQGLLEQEWLHGSIGNELVQPHVSAGDAFSRLVPVEALGAG